MTRLGTSVTIEMKRQAKKHQARNRRSADQRKAYLQGKVCAVCRCFPASEVHHIAGRNAKARDSIAEQYEHIANWLPVCGMLGRNCHDIIDKQSPALWACVAKMEMNELDLNHLKKLRDGKKFAVSLGDLHQAADDLESWRMER